MSKQQDVITLHEPHPSAGKQCAYHKDILALKKVPSTSATSDKDNNQSMLERYLDTDSSKQYALFANPMTGSLSIAKNCSCASGLRKSDRAGL